jgi:hypothetical protein
MVFSFQKKPVLLSAFFGGQKTGTEWSTKATDPVFWNCEMGEGNAQIRESFISHWKNSSLVIREIVH